MPPVVYDAVVRNRGLPQQSLNNRRAEYLGSLLDKLARMQCALSDQDRYLLSRIENLGRTP